MLCPKCKAEYRPGFTRCSDCDAELVEELPHSGNSAGNDQADAGWGKMKSVWAGKDEDRCVSLCRQLKAAGIPFRVDQRKHQFLRRVDEHYRIGVPPEFFNDARRVVIKGHPDFPDGDRGE